MPALRLGQVHEVAVVNLHSVVIGAISAINPQQTCQVQYSTGVTLQADGTPQPTYAPALTLQAQMQAMATRDLRQADGINLNGTYRRIYLFGDVEGTIRPTQAGGDLITFPNAVGRFPPGSVWLTVYPEETWSNDGWCAIVACLQNGS